MGLGLCAVPCPMVKAKSLTLPQSQNRKRAEKRERPAGRAYVTSEPTPAHSSVIAVWLPRTGAGAIAGEVCQRARLCFAARHHKVVKQLRRLVVGRRVYVDGKPLPPLAAPPNSERLGHHNAAAVAVGRVATHAGELMFCPAGDCQPAWAMLCVAVLVPRLVEV